MQVHFNCKPYWPNTVFTALNYFCVAILSSLVGKFISTHRPDPRHLTSLTLVIVLVAMLMEAERIQKGIKEERRRQAAISLGLPTNTNLQSAYQIEIISLFLDVMSKLPHQYEIEDLETALREDLCRQIEAQLREMIKEPLVQMSNYMDHARRVIRCSGLLEIVVKKRGGEKGEAVNGANAVEGCQDPRVTSSPKCAAAITSKASPAEPEAETRTYTSDDSQVTPQEGCL